MYQFESRVRYSEVDSERHLTLPAVMDYLQDCCTFQSEDMNIGVEYLAEQKQAWVLSSWEIKIRRYPVMGEKICVETWPYAFKGFYGYRNFRITNGQGEELVLANSVWVYMDMERMRLPAGDRRRTAGRVGREKAIGSGGRDCDAAGSGGGIFY